MKMDGKINKKELLYKRALITCVVMLFVSIVLKLFGSTLFNLDTDIPILQDIDKVIMSSVPLSFIYSMLLFSINIILVCMIVTKCEMSKIFRKLPMIIILVIISMYIKRYSNNSLLSFITDGFSIYLISVLLGNANLKECLIALLLNLLYQIISLFIRNLGFQLAYYGLIISMLFLIDYYIMLIITYLYLKKGETSLCGIFLQYFSYLRNLLLKKRTVSSKQCSSKCENDG